MTPKQQVELAEIAAGFYADPLGFVRFAFPWGEKGGPLEDFKGPRPKQEAFLEDLGYEIKARKFDGVTPVLPICMSISSGHGEGKSALIGMLAQFLMVTRDGLLGTVTANTGLQLSTKTWASIQTWNQRSIFNFMFEINAERFYRIGRKNDWFMSPQSCAEENSEAFAGQHNVKSTSVYLFDEDSNVSDKIHEVAQGGLTDGESMFFCFGNPTRREGKFFHINFGNGRASWNRMTLGPSRSSENPAGTRIWDAHDSPYSNKELQKEWLDFYGFDSDFYRVRVRGLAPMAGDTQFIPQDLIEAAQRRVPRALDDDPLVVGCDLSWGGNDSSCIRFRRGMDARSIPPIKIPGAQTRDDAVMVMKLADVLTREWNGRKVEMLFMDSAGACGPIARRLREMGFKNVLEVNFGGHLPNPKYKLARSYMWGMLREALPFLSIDGSLDLAADLAAPGYKFTSQSEILLEKKDLIIKRLGHSTDDGDALCYVKNTPITMADGTSRNIQDVSIGDTVRTPMGPRHVLALHRSIASRLTTVRFSNGARLQGKSGHRVFTWDSGFIRMDALSLTNAIETDSFWRRWQWVALNMWCIGGRSFGFKAAADILRQAGVRNTRRGFYTAGSGLTFTGIFLRDMRFIIKTAIGEIMSLGIWNWLRPEPISASICSSEMPRQQDSLKALEDYWLEGRLPPIGIDPMKAESGTVSTPAKDGRRESPSSLPVPYVENQEILTSKNEHDSALARVLKKRAIGGISRIAAHASSAARHLWRIVTGLQRVVPVSVVSACVLPTETFNLTVEDENVYYANGILVENCLTFFAPVKSKQTKEAVARKRRQQEEVGAWG